MRMLLTVILIGFLAGYVFLIGFYLVRWIRLKDFQTETKPSVFVSVVVAARNEEFTLPLLIKDLRHQSYPAYLFEVIIVDDYSTDNTAAISKSFEGTNTRMILPDVPPAQSSKKSSIASAIKKAEGELIVITDADCRVNKDWIRTIAGFHEAERAVFIAAPVRIEHDNSFLQVFQSLDFITLQGITAASVSSEFHTMCNGANLAYTRTAFESVNGFEGIDKVATGDDMLLMHKIRKKYPGKVRYLKTKDAIVKTDAMKTWRSFFQQRKRWASKTLVYDDYRIIFVLAFVLLFNLLFFVLLAAAFFNKVYWLHAVAFLVGKTIIEWPFVASVASFYGEQKLMRYFFFFQPLHIFYTAFVGFASQFGKYEWKGRRTR